MGSGEWEGASAVPCVGDPDRCITQRGCMGIACHEWPCTSLWSLKSMRRSLLQCAAVSSVAVLLQCAAVSSRSVKCCSVLQCCCSVPQCQAAVPSVAVCCSVVAVCRSIKCCSVFQCVSLVTHDLALGFGPF